MAKWVEYFIAQRTAQAGRRGVNRDTNRGTRQGEKPGSTSEIKNSSEGGVMSSIATLAIALSLVVMILTIAVILGFKSEVHSRLTLLSGDVIVTTNQGPNPSVVKPISRNEAMEAIIESVVVQHGSHVRHLAPYVARSVVVRGTESVEGVVLKGVDSTFFRELFVEGLIEGEVPLFGGVERSRNTIISSELAAELRLGVGDKLELMAFEQSGDMRRDIYRVGAIYTAGTGEAEKMVIIADMRNVQRLNGWAEGDISGYEVGLTDRQQASTIAREINREVLYFDSDEMEGVAAFSTEQLYPGIFDWLNALDLNAVVVISIMLIVAIFNIITAILILVLERMQMIGILKALGMTNSSIRGIFLHRASGLALRGMVWGNGIGIAVALLQRHFEIVKLDETGYLLSSVPIELGVGWLLLLNVGVVGAILLSVMLPTRIVSSIEPHKAIKFS